MPTQKHHALNSTAHSGDTHAGVQGWLNRHTTTAVCQCDEKKLITTAVTATLPERKIQPKAPAGTRSGRTRTRAAYQSPLPESRSGGKAEDASSKKQSGLATPATGLAQYQESEGE